MLGACRTKFDGVKMSSAKGSSQDTTSVGTSSANGSQSTWIVNKFGGTSVASAEAMSQVKEIVMNQVRR